VDGSYPKRAKKPDNVVDACRALEQAPADVPRSIRIQFPRMLIALYEIRNNRGVGHTGGDVDPNQMDAVTVVAMTNWVMAEFVPGSSRASIPRLRPRSSMRSSSARRR
jgi:hypothetical protein